jgi:riboflavin synthase
MFTGLVEELGRVTARKNARDGIAAGARIVIESKLHHAEPLALGESIAVEGVCITADAIRGGTFEADLSSETLARTTLGALDIGAKVNLERATKLGARMGGHIVSGHVDGVGAVVSRSPSGDSLHVVFSLPEDLARFVAEKGSICVNGVSLTVNEVTKKAPHAFGVMLIPHTRAKTTLDTLAPGSKVNLEVDVLARYAARLLDIPANNTTGENAGSTDASLLAALTTAGYM